MLYKCLTCSGNSVFLWRHAKDSLINVFRTRMCRQTLLFIVIVNCAIELQSQWSSVLSTAVVKWLWAAVTGSVAVAFHSYTGTETILPLINHFITDAPLNSWPCVSLCFSSSVSFTSFWYTSSCMTPYILCIMYSIMHSHVDYRKAKARQTVWISATSFRYLHAKRK